MTFSESKINGKIEKKIKLETDTFWPIVINLARGMFLSPQIHTSHTQQRENMSVIYLGGANEASVSLLFARNHGS